jgi:hypothetical protein
LGRRMGRSVPSMMNFKPGQVSMDPNRYEVSEPELLRGLRRF